MSDLEQYSQANTCPHCGRHPGRAERLPEWITHIATCPAKPSQFPRPTMQEIGRPPEADDRNA